MLSSEGKISVIVLPILTVLATVFLVLRLVQRRRKKTLAMDDWLLSFALLMLYVEDVGAFLLAVKGGEGKPMTSLTDDEVAWLFKMFFWPELGYTILIFTIKSSILISLRRIFWIIDWFRIAISFVTCLTIIWFFGVFFSVLFQCTPVDKAWIPTKPGHCINLLAFLWGNSVSNNIIDWMILLLPVMPVLKLHTDRTQKITLLGSFTLGSLACIASLVRAITTATIDENDLSKSVFRASIWTYIEPSMGIISACLPFLSSMIGNKVRAVLRIPGGIYIFGTKKSTSSTNDKRRGSGGLVSLVDSEAPTQEHPSYELDFSKPQVTQSADRGKSQLSV